MDQQVKHRRRRESSRSPGSPAANPVEAVALLAEPARRRIYDWVAAAGRPVARDEAAAALGIGRPLAAFHLDRLAAAGLLDVEYRRRTGRAGPGAGRPAKFYRRTSRELMVSLPARRYELIAELLAAAVEARAPSLPPPELRAVARDAGRGIGEAARALPPETAAREGPGPGRSDGGSGPTAEQLAVVLARNGYEPFVEPGGVVILRNCPFDALAARHRTLVCGTNVAFAEGLLEGLGIKDLVARLEPAPGRCCVVFGPQTDGEVDPPAR